jgi:hypothetical protein
MNLFRLNLLENIYSTKGSDFFLYKIQKERKKKLKGLDAKVSGENFEKCDAR